MNKKKIYIIGILILLGSISLFMLIDEKDEIEVVMFHSDLHQVNWEQITEEISDVIEEDANAILLQEMTLSWDSQKLKRANLRVQSEKTNKSYILSFDHEGNGKTLIHYLGKLEPKDKKIKAQEVIQLIQKHTLSAFQEESSESGATLILDITYGNQEFTNKNKMEGKLFKVTPSYVRPFDQNETVQIPEVVVSFLVNSNVYIIENMSGN